MIVTADAEPPAPAGRCATTAGSTRARGPRPTCASGFNYRLTEIQSDHRPERAGPAGLLEPRAAPGFAKIYDHAFSQLYGVHCLPLNTPERRNAYWKYPLQLELEKLACDPREIVQRLPRRGSLSRELMARVVR